MLTLLKKPTSEAAELAQPAWHPDFRNAQRLPDTKIIRTSFLLNGAAVLVAAVIVIGFSFQIYRLTDLTVQTELWQRQIDRTKAPSDQAIALQKKFQAAAAQITELGGFIESRPLVSDLLLHFGATLPDYLAFDRFDLSATNLNVRASVRGAPDQASGRASTYIQQLKGDAFLAQRFSEINLVNLNRSPQTGGLIVEISFKLKEAKKP